MTSLGGLGHREPPSCGCYDTGPLSSSIPLQCPGLSAAWPPAGRPGHLLCLLLYLHIAEHWRLRWAGVAPEYLSLGTFYQTPSTCSEVKRKQSEWKFCKRSVIRSELFDNEQTASNSKQTRDTVAKIIACDWVQIMFSFVNLFFCTTSTYVEHKWQSNQYKWIVIVKHHKIYIYIIFECVRFGFWDIFQHFEETVVPLCICCKSRPENVSPMTGTDWLPAHHHPSCFLSCS